MKNLQAFLVKSTTPILKATAVIDANQKGAVIVVDARNKLLGVMTDGDVRRAILAGIDLKQPVSVLLKRRAALFGKSLICCREDAPHAEQLALLQKYQLRHLPVVNEKNEVVGLALVEDLLKEAAPKMTAVVMAGGFGKRLSPLTKDTPKPMLPVDGKPVLERLITQLRSSGIHKVQISTHYKPDLIVNHFGDGKEFDVDIGYIQESQPLGTAGALSLLPPIKDPLLVINGDIITGVDFSAMQAFHNEHRAMMTVAVREVTIQVPYGVVKVDGENVTGLEEKPSSSHFMNAGIYLLSPEAMQFVPRGGKRMDMPDLINALVKKKKRVVSFPVREYWLDIGQMEDYKKAQVDMALGMVK